MADDNGSTVGISDVVFTIGGLVLYTLDITFDIVLLCKYHADGDFLLFASTLTALLGSSLIINVFSCWLFNHDEWNRDLLRSLVMYLCVFLQISPVFR